MIAFCRTAARSYYGTEITGVWTELYEEQLHHLNCRVNIIKLGTTKRKGKGASHEVLFGVGEGLRLTYFLHGAEFFLRS